VSASLQHQAEKRWVAIFVDSIRRGYFNSFGQKPRHILEYFMNGRFVDFLFIQAGFTSPKSALPHHIIIKKVIILQIKASLSKQNFNRSNVQLPGTV
jgi:hypothetical protein